MTCPALEPLPTDNAPLLPLPAELLSLVFPGVQSQVDEPALISEFSCVHSVATALRIAVLSDAFQPVFPEQPTLPFVDQVIWTDPRDQVDVRSLPPLKLNTVNEGHTCRVRTLPKSHPNLRPFVRMMDRMSRQRDSQGDPSSDLHRNAELAQPGCRFCAESIDVPTLKLDLALRSRKALKLNA
jgi:hypothetical protein